MTKTQKITSQIQALLSSANGRSRERLLTLAMVAQVLAEAMREGYAFTTGGNVAKAYNKKGIAYSTMAFALTNGPDYVAIRIQRNQATTSPATWAGPGSVRESDCIRWAEKQTLYTLVHNDWLILSRAECKLFLRSLTATTVKGAKDVMVTLQDSLAAGNCERVSNRVAGWFLPRTAVSAAELAKAINEREPILAPFAERAIQRAAVRQQEKK